MKDATDDNEDDELECVKTDESEGDRIRMHCMCKIKVSASCHRSWFIYQHQAFI